MYIVDKINSTLCDLLDEIAVEQSKRVTARQEQLVLAVIAASLKGTIAVVGTYKKEMKL